MSKKTALDIAKDYIFEKEIDPEHLSEEGWEIYDDFGKQKAVGPGLKLSSLPEEYRDMKVGQKIPKDVVSKAYESRLTSLDDSLTKEFGDVYSELSSHKKVGVQSLVYNTGQRGFRTGGKSEEFMEENPSYTTKAYKALKGGDLETFRKEAFDPEVGYVKSGGEVVGGLQTRRAADEAMFMTEEDSGVNIAMNFMKKAELSGWSQGMRK